MEQRGKQMGDWEQALFDKIKNQEKLDYNVCGGKCPLLKEKKNA